MFGNWQQMGMGGVPPPFFAQHNMMYPMYSGSQEAAVASAPSGPPPHHPHQWATGGGQLAPLVYPQINHPSMVPSACNAVLKHGSPRVGGDSSSISGGANNEAPPLPSNPAPPAPPTEEKPPLPPDPPPPDEESKQELTAKNPEEEQRMEKLKQQAAQWQQHKKQLDDAQQQYHYQLQQQQQQFHQMWMATQYPPPPTDHLMAAPPPFPPNSGSVAQLSQHTDLSSLPPIGGPQAPPSLPAAGGAAASTALQARTTSSLPSLMSATHSLASAEESTKLTQEVKSPDEANTDGNKKSNMNFSKKDPPPKNSSSDDKNELTDQEKLKNVEKEEEEFNRQYTQWKKQYDDWRLQNRDHPDREQFKQYEIQFTEIEAKMDEKRQDIIRRKKMLKGEYEPDSGDTYRMGKCGRLLESGSGQFRNAKKFGGYGGPGPNEQLPKTEKDCALDRHTEKSGDDPKAPSGAFGDEAKSKALESEKSSSSQKDLNKKGENDPLFTPSKSNQDNVSSSGEFLGGAGDNQFAGTKGRFDGNRGRFDGPTSQGPRYQGGLFGPPGSGVLGEGPKKDFKGPRADKEPEFRDSDMRSQGPNQGMMCGPRFNGPRGGGPGFSQNTQSGQFFNPGSFGGPGFNPNNRGFNPNRQGGDSAGPRGLDNLGNCGSSSMQRMGGSLHHAGGPSDGQFSRFPGHGGMSISPGAKSQHMSDRNHDVQDSKNSTVLPDRENQNKIGQKDGKEGSTSKTGSGGGGDPLGGNMDVNNGYQWKRSEPPQDISSGCHDSTDPCNSGNNFNNSQQEFNQNDNWRRFGPPPSGNMRGQGVRTRGGLQQPPPPHRNFEDDGGPMFAKNPLGMQGPPRMGPDLNFNMMRGGEPPGPRMMGGGGGGGSGGPCGMRPAFNSGMNPLGMGPHHRGMMRGGMGMQGSFRPDEMGRPFGMNQPMNRFDGRSRNEFNSMKQEGPNEREAGLMGTRGDLPCVPDQQQNFGGSFPGQQFSRGGNCPPNSFEMNREENRMPNLPRDNEYSRPPFDSHPNSGGPSDNNWQSQDRNPWPKNQFGRENEAPCWNRDGNSFAGGNQQMDPSVHQQGYNRDFPSDTGQSRWSSDVPGPHCDDTRYNQPRPSHPNAATPSADYDRFRYNNPPDARNSDFPRGSYDDGRVYDRYPDQFPRNDFNSAYTETIDYKHKAPKEIFDYTQDLPRNKVPPTIIDYGHKHANHLDEQELFKDTDLRIVVDGNQDNLRRDRGDRMHTDRDRSPMDGSERLRDTERDRLHSDVDRPPRGRDKDSEVRSSRDRNRPLSRDRDRDRDRGRDRDKFREGRYDQYSRGGRERLEEGEKWTDRKHDDRKFERDSRGRYNSPNRGYHNTDSSRSGESFSKCRPSLQSETKAEVVSADDLLSKSGQDKLPPQVVVIIRGLPGSGKTYVSKLIRDKVTGNGGTAPRMLCMDDYFMVEVEKVEKDPETNKMVKKKVLQYEYEPDLEQVYRQSILKSFKKTIDDGFFPFIIYDCVNEKVQHFEEFWSYAKSKGFQVYVATVHSDVSTCVKRNIHGRTNQDITKIHKNWEETPKHHIHLDIRSLLQDAAIPEVEMEDTTEEDVKKEENSPKDKVEAEEEDEPAAPPGYIKSKWEIDEVGQVRDKVLDKLDGIRLGKRRRSASPTLSLDDYLQLDVYRTRQTEPGKKRVRWADMEERKQQLRRRELGFVVGQTQRDWEKITDDSYADRALNRTKYI